MKTLWISVAVAVTALGIYTYAVNNNVPDNLGVNNGRLAKLPFAPRGVSTQTNDIKKKIEPIKMKSKVDTSINKIKGIIKKYPNSVIVQESNDYLHVVFHTETMKYKDDVEFYFNSTKNIIECRSVARVGYFDFNVNRKRYNEIKSLYEKK